MTQDSVETIDRSIEKVSNDIRQSRLMFMAPAKLELRTLQSLLLTVSRAGILSFEVLRRGVEQKELAQKLRALREFRDEEVACRNTHIGVGTVKNTEHLEFLIGPQPLVDFVVSPYFSEDVRRKTSQRLLYIPGVDNSTALETVERHGLNIWKWFPATTLGSATLKAWKPVLDAQTFVVSTGGVNIETQSESSNLEDWTPFGGAGIGSQFIKNGLVGSADWETIYQAITKAVADSKKVEVAFG